MAARATLTPLAFRPVVPSPRDQPDAVAVALDPEAVDQRSVTHGLRRS
jgi:hypothetical protein